MVYNYFQMISCLFNLFVCMIFKIPMCFYDVIVELMNIHEMKCQITDQAISGTGHDTLMRFWNGNQLLLSMSTSVV